MTVAAPTLSFRAGEIAGVLVRETLRSLRQARTPVAQTAPAAESRLKVWNPAPVLSQAQVHELDHVPAMSRKHGVDLNMWHAQNTREVVPAKPKKARKPRAPKSSTPPAEAADTAQASPESTARKPSWLDPLI